LRIATYNIAHGRGLAESNWDGGSPADHEARLQAIAAELRAWPVDVVVLEEVDFDASWSHRVNQAEVLARAAGFPYWIEQSNYDLRFPSRAPLGVLT
jgi:endonuclease/exonuclease/phosphatase family metal-dependent hydrolase